MYYQHQRHWVLPSFLIISFPTFTLENKQISVMLEVQMDCRGFSPAVYNCFQFCKAMLSILHNTFSPLYIQHPNFHIFTCISLEFFVVFQISTADFMLTYSNTCSSLYCIHCILAYKSF